MEPLIRRDVELLRNVRKRLGLTQKQLAKEAGVKLSLVADIESQRTKLTEKVFKPLWDALTRVEADRRQGVIKDDEVVLMWEVVARERQIAGLSLKQVAKKIGVDEADLAALERGEGHLPDDKLKNLVDFYERSHSKDWKWDVDDTKTPFADLANDQLLAEKKKRRERSPGSPSRGVPLSSLAGIPSDYIYVDPVQKERDELRRYVVLLKEVIASDKKVEASSEKIIANLEEIVANQKEMIEEYVAEIARLELLNKETSESKDREIQALREQLEAGKRLVTIPPDETWEGTGE